MHEASIALAIIEAAQKLVDEGKVEGKVAAVCVRVGRLTAVVPENLRFLFEALVRDTPLAGARLEVEEVPVRARCGACRHEFEIDEPFFLCPRCDSPDVLVLTGRELAIEALEVD